MCIQVLLSASPHGYSASDFQFCFHSVTLDFHFCQRTPGCELHLVALGNQVCDAFVSCLTITLLFFLINAGAFMSRIMCLESHYPKLLSPHVSSRLFSRIGLFCAGPEINVKFKRNISFLFSHHLGNVGQFMSCIVCKCPVSGS